MNVYPRKDEWAPIVTMLESAEYDSPEALAKAIVKQCYATFLSRSWYLTVVKVGETADGRPLQVAYGLSSTEGEAKRVQVPGQHMILPVSSAIRHEQWVTEQGDAA